MPAGNPLGYLPPFLLQQLQQSQSPGPSLPRLPQNVPMMPMTPMPSHAPTMPNPVEDTILDRLMKQLGMIPPATEVDGPMAQLMDRFRQDAPEPRSAQFGQDVDLSAPPAAPPQAGMRPGPSNMPPDLMQSNALPIYPEAGAPNIGPGRPQLPQGAINASPRVTQNLGMPPKEEDSKSPVTRGVGSALLDGISRGLPGALVAFAAHKAQSPEIAQQYAQMKARELEDAKAIRAEEIDRMQIRADQARAEASQALQFLQLRTNIDQQAREAQQSFSADPQAFVRVMTALSETMEAAGGDKKDFLASHPIMFGKAWSTFRDEVATQLGNLSGDPERQSKAMIYSPFTNELISVKKAGELMFGLQADGTVLEPVGSYNSNQLRPVTTTNASGVTTETITPTAGVVGKPQVRQPAPKFTSQVIEDPGTGRATMITTNEATGVSVEREIQTGLSGMARTLGMLPSDIKQGLRAQHAAKFLEEATGKPPSGREVAKWLEDIQNVADVDELIANTVTRGGRGAR